MSLLLDVQNYLRRYGSATQPELAQQLRTSPEVIQMMVETLRAKGKVRMSRVMPSCMSASCGGSCCKPVEQQSVRRTAVMLYQWIDSSRR